MTKKTRIVRFTVLCLVLVHLLAMTCFAADYTGFDGVQVWTEGAMTPLTTENTGNALKITSTNDPADWWKVKLEMPRTVEAGKVYEAKFVFTSDATGTIKYHVGNASFLTANEYNVQAGENTFAIRFVAGNDDYSCLELGGLGKFVLTFTEISVKEEVQEEEPGEHTHSFTNGVCSCGANNGFAGIQTWTEGSLTPVVREDTESTMKITSANAAGDWWKVKVELPRSVESGKTYEAKFVFNSNVTGTIKYNVDGATYLTSNEYNVVEGANTFTVRFTAGADTYNCLELGGLGQFELTFSEISVAEETADGAPETGDAGIVMLWGAVMTISVIGACLVVASKKVNF